MCSQYASIAPSPFQSKSVCLPGMSTLPTLLGSPVQETYQVSQVVNSCPVHLTSYRTKFASFNDEKARTTALSGTKQWPMIASICGALSSSTESFSDSTEFARCRFSPEERPDMSLGTGVAIFTVVWGDGMSYRGLPPSSVDALGCRSSYAVPSLGRL